MGPIASINQLICDPLCQSYCLDNHKILFDESQYFIYIYAYNIQVVTDFIDCHMSIFLALVFVECCWCQCFLVSFCSHTVD
jgi:hypothetical protein